MTRRLSLALLILLPVLAFTLMAARTPTDSGNKDDLHLAAATALPHGIAYDLAPAPFEFVAKAGSRPVKALDVRWSVHDVWQAEPAKGTFSLPLRAGKEARHTITFTPPRYGWYAVTFEAWQGDRFLTAVGRHLGVTPKFAGMPVLAADAPIRPTGPDVSGVQAVRLTLQRDLREGRDVPAEPASVWSEAGPCPAALALRTRQAMVGGKSFAGRLDFGPEGNKLFLGLRYEGRDGGTVSLRSLGSRRQPLYLTVRGGTSLVVVDSFGNEERLPVSNGRATVTLSTLPAYLRLAKGQLVAPPRIDFGRNYAGEATFTYSAEHSGNFDVLTDGIPEVPDLDGPRREPWSGGLPSVPQTLEMRFPHPRAVDRLVLFGARAGDTSCALLDYDVQYHDGNGWQTLAEARAPAPQGRAGARYMDENIYMHHFQPVTTDRLRLVVRRTANGSAAGTGAGAPSLALRQVEIYGPPPEVAAP